jgi:hypothetical protein
MAEPLSSLILPELGPVLPSFARFAPPPAQNILAAELESRTGPTDIVLDLHGRGGWVARAAISRLRRAYVYESNGLTRLLAEVVLRPPDLRHFDAAVGTLAGQPRGDQGLRQSLNELFASRCATCRRQVVVDELIWDGDADRPSRKAYRCASCRDQVGGGEQRSAPTDDEDAARAAAVPAGGRPYAVLRDRFPHPRDGAPLVESLLSLYTPRSLVAIEAILERLDADLRAAPIEAALRLALLHVLLPASRLNSYPGRVAALRISNGRLRNVGDRQWREHNPWHLFEEGARLVRGFLQALESTGTGAVQARLGDDLVALVDGAANVGLRRGSPGQPGNGPMQAGGRAAPDEVRSRVRLVLTQPPVRWTTENLSFAYLGTSVVLGRDAAAELPLESLFGQAPRTEWGWEAAAMRRSLVGVAPVLAPDARVVVMLDPGGPEGLVACALGGVGAGYRLSAAVLAESEDAVGGTLEFVPPGARVPGGPRSRANVPLEIADAWDDGPSNGHAFQLSSVEKAVTDVAVQVLQARGEPARFERLLGEVLVGLDRLGHLRRLVGTRTYSETEARSERSAAAFGLHGDSVPASTAGTPDVPEPAEVDTVEPTAAAELPDATATADAPDPDADPTLPQPVMAPADSPLVTPGADHVGLLLDLVVGELRRSGNGRLAELEPGRWWLGDPDDVKQAALPLSDRVEWAVFSLMSTSGGLTERGFFDRVSSMFRGHDTPDEALVRACLDSYRDHDASGDKLRTRDELQARYREHAELCGLLVEYGHRLGLRCWVGRTEQRRPYKGQPLAALLSESEQHAYLPLISNGDVDALETTDVIWYLRGKAAFLFEVEWTAMIGEPLLRRGPRIPNDEGLVRFLVLLPERTELARFKLARSPLLRAALERDNWHVLKADHLRTLVEREGADLDRLAPFLGLDPEVETEGEQMPLFS